MSRHRTRQSLGLECGATDIVSERGEVGAEVIKTPIGGIGADSVVEGVGTSESMQLALSVTRPGGMRGYVGVPYGVQFEGQFLFFSQTGMLGGPAPVRRFLPHLLKLILTRQIDPGELFDLELPIADVAQGYRTMDERRAIEVLSHP